MYMGVKNHRLLPSVASYGDARKAFEIWTSKPRRGNQVAQVNRHGSSIVFRLYETDVIVWHEDNSFDVTNYGTLTTTGFAERFTPRGVRLHFPTARRGHPGGHDCISFQTGYNVPGGMATGYALCQGNVVNFAETEHGTWEPDPDTCCDITLPVGVDRKISREISTRYHLKDFEMWLSMAPMHLAAGGDPLEHDIWDLHTCLEALEERDFRKAAQHLPQCSSGESYGREPVALPIRTAHWKGIITMSSVTKLRKALLHEHDALHLEARKVWSTSDFDKGMKRVREMRALGIWDHKLGPK